MAMRRCVPATSRSMMEPMAWVARGGNALYQGKNCGEGVEPCDIAAVVREQALDAVRLHERDDVGVVDDGASISIVSTNRTRRAVAASVSSMTPNGWGRRRTASATLGQGLGCASLGLSRQASSRQLRLFCLG